MFPFVLLFSGLLFVALVWVSAEVVYKLVADVPAIRRRAWVCLRPQTVPATDDLLSPIMRLLVTQLGPPLNAAGFEHAASLHAPQFSGDGGWTQILYVNRQTGERASFLEDLMDGANTANLLLATELEGVGTIVTGLTPGPVQEGEDLSIRLTDLLIRHRSQVRESTGNGSGGRVPVGVLPARGREHDWLAGRMKLVARDMAAKLNYRLDRDGMVFRMPWRGVLRLAFRKRSPHALQRGFEVLAPVSAGPVVLPSAGDSESVQSA